MVLMVLQPRQAWETEKAEVRTGSAPPRTRTHDAVEDDGEVDTDDTERVATDDHLTQTGLHSPGREQGHGQRAEQIEEDDYEGRVGESHAPNRVAKGTEGEGGAVRM